MAAYKVAHVITGLSTGGAEMMLFKLLSALKQEQCQSIVISLGNGGQIAEKIQGLNVPVYMLRMQSSRPTVKGLVQLCRIIRDFSPDIIQGWMYHGNAASTLAKILNNSNSAVIWNIRQSADNLENDKRLTRWLIQLSCLLSWLPKKIIYNSFYSAKRHELLHYQRKKTVVISNGFDCDTFIKSQEKRNLIRKELGIGEDVFLIGMIGRYHPMKGHNCFLQAAEKIAKEHDKISFLCAGFGVDSKNKEIAALISTQSLKGRVFLLGERRDTPALYAALDLATLSSVSEAFPNVVGEAMSAEVPCVVTDVGDARLIVGETGTVVSPGSPDALADAWRNYLNMPIQERVAKGAYARQRILEKFSLSSVAKQYDSLYREVIA